MNVPLLGHSRVSTIFDKINLLCNDIIAVPEGDRVHWYFQTKHVCRWTVAATGGNFWYRASPHSTCFRKDKHERGIAKVSFWGTHLSSVARKAFCRQSWAGWVRLVAVAKEMCVEMIAYLRLLAFWWGQMYKELRTFWTTPVRSKRPVTDGPLALRSQLMFFTFIHCASEKSLQSLRWLISF